MQEASFLIRHTQKRALGLPAIRPHSKGATTIVVGNSLEGL